jgi:DNA-binding transcriptional LysR family regulator
MATTRIVEERSREALPPRRQHRLQSAAVNVPATVARLVLPPIVASFPKAYPDIRLEVIVEDGFVDVLAAGCDAGIRYDERLEQDMIAVQIHHHCSPIRTACADLQDYRAVPMHPYSLCPNLEDLT